MEVYSDADEILQEEINQYKVREGEYGLHEEKFMTSVNQLLVIREFQQQQQLPGSMWSILLIEIHGANEKVMCYNASTTAL